MCFFSKTVRVLSSPSPAGGGLIVVGPVQVLQQRVAHHVGGVHPAPAGGGGTQTQTHRNQEKRRDPAVTGRRGWEYKEAREIANLVG